MNSACFHNHIIGRWNISKWLIRIYPVSRKKGSHYVKPLLIWENLVILGLAEAWVYSFCSYKADHYLKHYLNFFWGGGCIVVLHLCWSLPLLPLVHFKQIFFYTSHWVCSQFIIKDTIKKMLKLSKIFTLTVGSSESEN